MATSTYKNAQQPPTDRVPAPQQQRKRTMATAFKSFLNTARQTISGTATPAGSPACTELFPKVDPVVDGEDCDHDCNSCVVKYPKGFKIEEDDELYGHVKGWSTHILVATGKTDWVRDVADEKGSLMEAIEKKADVKISNGVSSLNLYQMAHRSTDHLCRNSCYRPRIYLPQPTPQTTQNPPQSSSYLPL